jgi:dihydropteroate synthase
MRRVAGCRGILARNPLEMIATARADAAAASPSPEPRFFALSALSDILTDELWLRPTALLSGSASRAAIDASGALPLAGGPLAFAMVELLAPEPSGAMAAALGGIDEVRRWSERGGPALARRVAGQLERLSAPRPPWAGFPLDRPLVMGIVNATPDSFSDGGEFLAPERAIAQGRALRAAGADIIDVGGESMRPGASPVAAEEEVRRIAPVVRTLAAEGAVVSIDTRHALTMERALAAGARIINDVAALEGDPRALAVAAQSRAAVALMHMQGEPQTMQRNPTYRLASHDVVAYLAGRVERCLAAGIDRARIVVDPGIGFGKDAHHNLEIMARLGMLHALGCGVLLGISRKSLIDAVHSAAPKERIPGSLAGALQGLAQGVQIVRVHDVAETRQAIATWCAMAEGA